MRSKPVSEVLLSAAFSRNQKKIHHGDTEGTERRRRRMLGLFFSVPSVSPW